MARPDLYPSPGPVSSQCSVSRKSSTAESMPPPYAASADPHTTTSSTMTKPLYDQPPTPNDGHFYPIYPEFYDFNSADHSGAAASCGGGGGGAGGQLHPEFSAMSQAEGGYPPGWDYGLVDVELPFPPSPGIMGGGEHGLQPHAQAPWDCNVQTYSAMMGSQRTIAMASPMSQYVQVEETMGSFYDPLKWPPPPLGQISPSPSQSSYYASSPVSGGGAQFSRHNSCSSIPASLAAAIEQSRFDARFRPLPEQAPSPGRGLLTPGGTVAANGFHPGAESSSSADRETDPRRTVMRTATTTADNKAGTLSPAVTPSPKDSAAAAPSQPAPQSARRPSDQQTPKSSGTKKLLPARRAAQEKQQVTTSRSQGQKQAHQPQSQPRAQAKPEAAPSQPAPPTPRRTRNREAANKCRVKTKLAMADLESTERAMSSEHQALSATARGLRDEVLLLKNELLAHGNCDDTLIQQYLTNQARMVGSSAMQQVPQSHHHHQQHNQRRQ